jgi:hypothetical protein
VVGPSVLAPDLRALRPADRQEFPEKDHHADRPDIPAFTRLFIVISPSMDHPGTLDRKRWILVGLLLAIGNFLIFYFWRDDEKIALISDDVVGNPYGHAALNATNLVHREACNVELTRQYFSKALSSRFAIQYSRDDDPLPLDSTEQEEHTYPPQRICPWFDAFPANLSLQCSDYGLLPRKGQDVRVYDVTLFGYDLDTLELRWRTLLPAISKFIVIEAQRTYTNRSRFPPTDPLGTLGRLFQPGGRFADLKDRVVHIVLGPNDWPQHLNTLQENQSVEGNALEFEGWIRNLYVNKTILDKSGIREGDLLMSSDADEIPRPSIVHLLKRCSVPRPKPTKPIQIEYECIETPIHQWSFQTAEDTITFASLFPYSNISLEGMQFRNRIQPDGYAAPISCIRWGGWSCSGCGLGSPLELLRKAYWQSHPYGAAMSPSDSAAFDGMQLEPDTLNYTERLLGWKRELSRLPPTVQKSINNSIEKLSRGEEAFEGGDVYRLVDPEMVDLPWWLDAVYLNQTRYDALFFSHFINRKFWAKSLLSS